jgi:spore germination cell wall hydrolase CwlJ-like protein
MCLATGIYFEARGEPEQGQIAVGQVILNRVAHPLYPETICGVVFENQHRRNKCQFSFACDGRSDRPRNKVAWEQSIRIAKKVINGKAYVESVGKSTHYHANYVSPRWIRDMIRLDKIGKHIFYSMRGWS